MSYPAQTQHGLKTWPRLDSSLCALRRGWWRGGVDLFSQWHPDKDGDWEGTNTGISAGLFGPTSFLFHLFIWSFGAFPLLRVLETQRCLQKCCASPWLWSCTSTLWAQISATMTGTWTNEWHPVTCYHHQLLTNVPWIQELDTIAVIHHASSTPIEQVDQFINTAWWSQSVAIAIIARKHWNTLANIKN